MYLHFKKKWGKSSRKSFDNKITMILHFTIFWYLLWILLLSNDNTVTTWRIDSGWVVARVSKVIFEEANTSLRIDTNTNYWIINDKKSLHWVGLTIGGASYPMSHVQLPTLHVAWTTHCPSSQASYGFIPVNKYEIGKNMFYSWPFFYLR